MSHSTNDDLNKKNQDNLDDLFMSDANENNLSDPFADFNSAGENGLNNEGDVFNFDAESQNPFSDEVSDDASGDISVDTSIVPLSDGIEIDEATKTDDEAVAAAPKGKKGKKAKVKAKVVKVKVEKKAKGPRLQTPKVPGDGAIFVLGIFLLAIIVIGNLTAFVGYGMGALTFLVFFNVLGLILLAVPFLFWKKRRDGEFLNLFDVLLGCALIFVVLACMVVLIAQSQKYGTSVKGNARAAVVDSRA